MFFHTHNAGRSDSPLWNIDDAAHCQIVNGIIYRFQISEQILDFLTRIEVDAAYNLIRNIRHEKFFFKHTGLGIRSV